MKTVTVKLIIFLALGSLFSSICSAQIGSIIDHRHVSFDISPDGKSIVFSSAIGDLFLLDLKSKTTTQLTKNNINEISPVFSPDGKSILYSKNDIEKKCHSLYVRSLDGKKVTRLTNSARVKDSMAAYSRDGSHIAFVRAHLHRRYSMGGWTWDDYDIYVMKSDGTNLKRLTNQLNYSASGLTFADDGKSILFSSERRKFQFDLTSTIFEIPVSGGKQPKNLFEKHESNPETASLGSEPQTSVDGKRILFISDRKKAYHYDVCLMDRNGKNVTQLGVTQIDTYNLHPRLMPDGKSVLFLSRTKPNVFNLGRMFFELWQVDVNTKKTERIADNSLFSSPQDWKKNK